MAAILFYTSNLVVSTTATVLGTSATSNLAQLLVQNDPVTSAVVTVRVGNASGQFVALVSNVFFVTALSSLDQVYIIASGGSATVNWFARTAQ